MQYEKAIKAVDKHHVLLIYPVKNQPDPPSLWSVLHPRSEMRWDWSEDADPRVVRLWHLKNELAEGGDVVYAKWYQNRATLFSLRIFPAFLKLLGATSEDHVYSSRNAAAIYDQLLDNSPQTPKMLKSATGLTHSHNRSAFEKAMKFLWQKLLIVGTGEVDEGQFPALAAGATKHLFEGLWDEAEAMEASDAETLIRELLPHGSQFLRYLRKRAPRGLVWECR